MNDTKLYVKKIIIIILLTAMPSFLILPVNVISSLSWILGSIASLGNFLWLSRITMESMEFTVAGSKVHSMKGFYLRYAVLIVYSLLTVYFLNLNILIFGIALFSAQIAIYLEMIFSCLLRFKQRNENNNIGDKYGEKK